MSAKRGLRIRGLRQRWLVNAVLPIVLVVIAIVTVYTLGVRRTYYSAMRSGLETRARVAADNFSSYGLKSYSEYFRYASITAETFEEKDRLELQFISANGKLVASSYGKFAGRSPSTPEIQQAIDSQQIRHYKGRNPLTGERILAVSSPMIYTNGEVIGVLRYVTSLRNADLQILMIALIAVTIGLLFIGSIFFLSSFFIKSILVPVSQINATAKRIAAGSYGVQIPGQYDDEIGELCDTINYMSDEINRAERMKNDFISSVSHELRTPTTVILAACEDARKNARTPADYQAALDVVDRQAHKMSQLIASMLEITRLDQGTQKVNWEYADLSDLVTVICDEQTMVARRGIRIGCAAEPDIFIDMDVFLMSRVVQNLLDNAFKFGVDGGWIHVALRRTDTGAQLTVQDNGVGISQEDLDRIWQRFYQADPSRQESAGLGLGLSMVQQIVALHGGTVAVTSAPGRGTTFTVTLPEHHGKEEK